MFNSKHIQEMLKDISYIGVSKPDTPDIDRIEEVNNPEGEKPKAKWDGQFTLRNKVGRKHYYHLKGDKVVLMQMSVTYDGNTHKHIAVSKEVDALPDNPFLI